MPSSENKSIRVALIPWIFALAALVGLNAIAPDFLSGRKDDSARKTGFSQRLDNAQATAPIPDPPVFLISQSATDVALLSSHRLNIVALGETPRVAFHHAEVRGRAPPMTRATR